jgi:hypothetical protein
MAHQARPEVNKPKLMPLIAGVLSGVVGLLVFLTIHHFWIRPIWFILPAGLPVACLGGLAAGWSYAEIGPRLPPRPWTWLAEFGLIASILAPALILAQVLPPVVDIKAGRLVGTTGELIMRLTLGFFMPVIAAGALTGWLLRRTIRAAASTALAGLAFALGPGHNIPFLGNTPAVGKELVLLIAIVAASSVVLVEANARLERLTGHVSLQKGEDT